MVQNEDKKKKNKLLRNDINKEVKSLKRNLKYFRKVSNKDFKEGINTAKKLLHKIDIIETKILLYPKLKDKLEEKNFDKMRESLNLYIENVSNVLKFKEKYNSSKGV